MSVSIRKALSKIPNFAKGENNAFYGKKHNETSKNKMSNSQKLYFSTHPERLEKMRKDKLGTHHTEESKNKTSLGIKRTYQRIHDEAEKLKKEGFIVIPIAEVVPDIIAIKDGNIYAYEVEYGKPNYGKYDKNNYRKYFDDIIWLLRKP